MSNLLRVATGLALIALGYAFAQLSLIADDPVPAPRTAILVRTSEAPIDEALFRALQEPDSLGRVGQTARVLATSSS